MTTSCLILARQKSSYTNYLKEHLDNAYVVCDNEISDEEVEKLGFYGLTKTVKTPSSWDKAFFLLHFEKIDKFDYLYFIEDDVFSKDANTFRRLFASYEKYDHDLITCGVYSKSQYPDWLFWQAPNNEAQYFNEPYCSFNPFCRLSSRLVKEVLNFRQEHNKFIFNEVIFASLAYKLGYQVLNFKKSPERNKYYGRIGGFPGFRYRPEIKLSEIKDDKIYHPFKDGEKFIPG